MESQSKCKTGDSLTYPIKPIHMQNYMQSNRVYYQNKRSEMTQFLPHRYKKVLEIGCGEGAFSFNLNPKCEVWGVEPDEQSSKVASERMELVLVGTYDEVSKDLPDGSFDLVICNDVIEHMVDHDAFFSSIKDKLKENGYLVASIPNVRYWANLHELLFHKDWNYRDSGILDKTHLRFFTEVSLKRTLESHGFLIEELDGINSPKSRKKILCLLLITIITLGYFRDIKYLQYGFRARKSEKP